MKKIYGYIRQSHQDQKENNLLTKLLEAGVPESHIYTDNLSATNDACTALEQLIRRLNPGDTLFINTLSHLGKNSDEVKERWQLITKDCGCDVVVLNMPLLDTRRDENIKDIVVQLFDETAKIRKSYSSQRQAEGIKRAKEQNVSFGRHAKPIPKEFKKIAGLYEKKQISARAAAERLSVSSDTFLKWYRNTKASSRSSEEDQDK